MQRSNRRTALIAWGIVFFFLLSWEAGVRLLDLPVYLLPSPSHVLVTLVKNAAMYADASLMTLGEALIGLLLGLLAGAAIAVLLTLLPGIC